MDFAASSRNFYFTILVVPDRRNLEGAVDRPGSDFAQFRPAQRRLSSLPGANTQSMAPAAPGPMLSQTPIQGPNPRCRLKNARSPMSLAVKLKFNQQIRAESHLNSSYNGTHRFTQILPPKLSAAPKARRQRLTILIRNIQK